MVQRLGDREICVVKLNVFADKRDLYRIAAAAYALDKLRSLREVGLFRLYAELTAYDIRNI